MASSCAGSSRPKSLNRAFLAVVTGLLLVLCLFAFHALMFAGYCNDDAYITFRYSRFLALDRGPFYNIGEHVEGYTNFLLMLALSMVIEIWGPQAVVLGAKAIGLLSALGTLVLIFVLSRLSFGSSEKVAGSLCGIIAAGLVAASPAFALNSMSGLETALFCFLLTGGVVLGTLSTLRGQWFASGIVLGAAALTRPEGVILAGVYFMAQTLCSLLRKPGSSSVPLRRVASKHLIPDALLFATIVAGHLVFRIIFYDGELLPNTYHAKAGGFAKHDGLAYAWNGALTPLGGLIGLVAAVAGWCMAGRKYPHLLPMAAVAVVGALLPALTGPDWMLGYRMSLPYVPMLAVLVVAGWMRLAGRFLPSPRLAGCIMLVAVAGAWLLQAQQRADLLDRITLRARGYETGHLAMANWLRNEAAQPGDTIALMDIGLVGYHCIDQNILDITGLTDRHIARSPGGFLDKSYDVNYVFDRKPRFIVLTLTAPGDPFEIPAADTPFETWTAMEERIAAHSRFRRYLKPQRAPAPDDDWLASLAHSIGAERVFQHFHPGCHYLLCVFRRQDDQGRAEAPPALSTPVAGLFPGQAHWVLRNSGQ